MSDNQIGPLGNRFLDDGSRDRQTSDNALANLLAITDQQPHVVPFFGQLQGHQPLEDAAYLVDSPRLPACVHQTIMT
jgi:hypothetical protein